MQKIQNIVHIYWSVKKIIVHALAEESKSLKQSGKKCDEMAPKGTCAMSVTLSEPL
jgi:hypothetical protein